MRRVDDPEVRWLSRLIMQMQPGALLGPLDEQHNVFQKYWPRASAGSFRAGVLPGAVQTLRASP